MSINIYWGGSINDSNPLYAALSPEDKKFLLPDDLLGQEANLLTLLILSKISFVSPESIVSICERIRKTHGATTYADLDKMAVDRGAKDLRHYLNRFCGVRTNLETLSTSDFGKFLVSDLPKLTAADARKYEEQQRRVLREKYGMLPS